jgi:HK97 family phage prohead protease
MAEEVTKLYTVAYKGTDDEDVAIASTGAIDRDGEIIDPKGWELDNYRAAGLPIQADHNSSVFATIGNALWAKVSGGKLKFKPDFHEKTQAGRDAKALWDAGIVRTFSVGFLPKEWVDGDGKEGWWRKYIKQDLLEISMTPVPANPEAARETSKAISKAFHDGIIKDADFAEYLAPGSTKEEEPDNQIELLQASINELLERIAVLEAGQLQVTEDAPEIDAPIVEEHVVDETPVDESIEISEEIEIPDGPVEEIELDEKHIKTLIEAETAKVADVIIATKKGKVVEIE